MNEIVIHPSCVENSPTIHAKYVAAQKIHRVAAQKAIHSRRYAIFFFSSALVLAIGVFVAVFSILHTGFSQTVATGVRQLSTVQSVLIFATGFVFLGAVNTIRITESIGIKLFSCIAYLAAYLIFVHNALQVEVLNVVSNLNNYLNPSVVDMAATNISTSPPSLTPWLVSVFLDTAFAAVLLLAEWSILWLKDQGQALWKQSHEFTEDATEAAVIIEIGEATEKSYSDYAATITEINHSREPMLVKSAVIQSTARYIDQAIENLNAKRQGQNPLTTTDSQFSAVSDHDCSINNAIALLQSKKGTITSNVDDALNPKP